MTIPTEVATLINSSGNNFHVKVARWFQTNGWSVVVSPYYMDQTQGKAREIDLVAERLWPVRHAYSSNLDYVAVRLVIECKYVPGHSVFWFAGKDRDAALDLVCSTGSFRANNNYTEKHHYLALSLSVAKLFASSTGRAHESDPFYKALNQVLNAMVSMRGRAVSSSLTKRSGTKPLFVLEYPVVVCNSFAQMFAVEIESDAAPSPIGDNFQLEARYAYIDSVNSPHDEHFLVDFVEFERLPQFADAIDTDAKAAAYLGSRN